MAKKALMILMERMARKGRDSHDDGDQGDDGPDDMGEDVGLEEVAQDLIDAVKEGDASAVADALRAAFHACSQEDE